jgi:hypothetical protein
MTGHKKSWIFVKGCEYSPNRSLSLGQLLTDPFDPSIPLLPDGPLPIPEQQIEHSYQDGVSHSSGSTLDVSFRIWAEVDLLPVQGNIGSSRKTSNSLSWHFDKLEGQIFIPHMPDIVAALQVDTVVSQIRRSRFNFRKRLYMVTGVRIARGANMSKEKSYEIGLNNEVGVDLAYVGGPPMNVGIGGGITTGSNSAQSFQGASDFVYAYRLCEVHYGKDVYTKPYTGGETYHQGEEDDDVEMGDADEVEEEEEEYRIVVEKIDGSDYAGDGQLRPIAKAENGEEDFYMAK